ncbi:MAG: response regulator [Cardiobacteriaceae bacterium]|nr:response regulator [Cardiobacteriaceae bacterium]
MIKRALIVDDSRLARLTLKRLLEKNGVEVNEAEGVIDAEELLGHIQKPDVVFMDIMMPDLDGYAGLARLRDNPDTRSLPVIMYSGDSSDEARDRAKDAGATGYLQKPADGDRLNVILNAINSHIQKTGTAPSAPRPEVKPQAAPKKIERFEGLSLNASKPTTETSSSSTTSATTIASAAPASTTQNAPLTSPNTNLATNALANAQSDMIKRLQTRADDSESRLSEVNQNFQVKTNELTLQVKQLGHDVSQQLAQQNENIDKRLSHSVNELEKRLQNSFNDHNHRITQLERRPAQTGDTERLQRDIVYLQRQLVSMEKFSKIAIAVGSVGIVLGLLSVMWHILK